MADGERDEAHVHARRLPLSPLCARLSSLKLHVASSVVNQQNATLATMNTEELLDLFQISPTAQAATGASGGAATGRDDAVGMAEAAAAAASGKRSGGAGLQTVLEGVGELWGQQQYDEQFDLDGFLATLQ